MTTRHHVSGAGYLVTWLALVVLTVTTFLLSRLHLGAWEMVVALGIAVAKATLVILFFMHLLEQRFANRLVVGVSVGFIVLIVSLVVADVATRDEVFATPPAYTAPGP